MALLKTPGVIPSRHELALIIVVEKIDGCKILRAVIAVVYLKDIKAAYIAFEG